MAPLFPPQKNGLGKHCDERLAQKENSMKSKIAPGTSERLPWQILLFSLPLMASNVLQVLFNMADIAVIGRFAGSLSMAAVGSTATAVTLFTGILIGSAAASTPSSPGITAPEIDRSCKGLSIPRPSSV